MLCFRKIPAAKMFMDKKGGVTWFSSKGFCPTLPTLFVEEPFCAVFQKLPVAKKFMDKRWEYQDCPPKTFCLSAEKRRRGSL